MNNPSGNRRGCLGEDRDSLGSYKKIYTSKKRKVAADGCSRID